jgi:predicted XRE-type DNA-binding protein
MSKHRNPPLRSAAHSRTSTRERVRRNSGRKTRRGKIELEVGSGNVFADLGFADADDLNFKVSLAVRANQAIETLGLPLAGVAKILATTPPQLAALRAFRLDSLAAEELASFVDCLETFPASDAK